MKHFLTGILFCVLALGGFAQDEYVDSLRNELTAADDATKASLYYDLFDYYSRIDNNLSDKYADTILLYANKCNSEYWLDVAYLSKGFVKYKLGDYSAALEYYGKSEKYAKKINDSRLLNKLYNNMGMVYYELYDNETAKRYYDLAIETSKVYNDGNSYAVTLVNIANLYYDNEDYDKIFHFYDSALNIASDKDIKIAVLNNLAYLHHLTGDYDEAQNDYAKILSLLDTNTDIYMYASILNSMSSIYIQHEEYGKAIDYLAEVDSICNANSFDKIRLILYQNYHDYYLKNGDLENSILYIEMYNSLRDSIYSADLRKELNELENRNEREKAALEMNLRDEEISHQKTLNSILFSIIAIVLIFIAVIAFLLVKKNRLNRTLNKLNADLKLRDEEISSNLDYAREIQLGCMSNSLTESNLQMFVLDRPKVVVGGDFYISQTKGDASYVVVGDCTGHGISGGFLSVLGIKSVYAAIEKYDTLPEMASFINNEFCEIVSSAENLKGESLCLSMVSICSNELRFLGSKQKMWIVSGDKGDSSSVSPLACKPEVRECKSANAIMGNAVDEEFTEEIINVKSGDVVFLSSDGYPDQFGAEGKLKYPRFRNLLLECAQMEPDKAKSFLSEKLDLWRGDLEQTDDVMVVGMYF